MDLATLIAGPQMIGVVLLIVGVIFYRYPPKHINSLYGYRMPSAQKSQEIWNEANRYSAICMLKSGLVLVLAGLLITFILKDLIMEPKLKAGLTALFLIASGPIPCIFIIVSTERHLETFNKEQK
jgi:uncharacterized membrane protein